MRPKARRYAWVPPMDSGDEPLPRIKRGPFSMPMGGPFSTPIDSPRSAQRCCALVAQLGQLGAQLGQHLELRFRHHSSSSVGSRSALRASSVVNGVLVDRGGLSGPPGAGGDEADGVEAAKSAHPSAVRMPKEMEGRFARERETGVFLADAPCNHLRPPCSSLFGSLLSQVGSPVGKPLKILGFLAALGGKKGLFCRLSLYFSLLPGRADRRRPVLPDCNDRPPGGCATEQLKRSP